MKKSKYTVRADGRLQKKIPIYKDGVKKYQTIYANSEKEMDLIVDELKYQQRKGVDITSRNDTFGEWLKKWLKAKGGVVCESKHEHYTYMSKHLEDLSCVKIGEIKKSDIEDLLLELSKKIPPNSKKGKPYSYETLKTVKSIAKQVLQYAVDDRVIEYNPATNAIVPKTQAYSLDVVDDDLNFDDGRRALSESEREWIETVKHDMQIPAMIMLYSGLRRGEMIPLRWGDINFVDKVISVNKKVEFTKRGMHLKKGTKSNGRGGVSVVTRNVYVPNKLISFLEPIKGNDGDLIITKKNGEMMSKDAWRSKWESYIKTINLEKGDFKSQKGFKKPKGITAPFPTPVVIPRITPHWLRHSFITMMYLAGVDVATAQKQAGHSDIRTTLKIYTHLDETFKKKNIDKLNDFLSV